MPRAANLETSGVVERASGIRMLVSLKGIDMTTTAPPSAPVTIRSVLLGLLGIPPSVGAENTAISAPRRSGSAGHSEGVRVQLTRIKNWEQVTGVHVDALTALHGLTGQ